MPPRLLPCAQQRKIAGILTRKQVDAQCAGAGYTRQLDQSVVNDCDRRDITGAEQQDQSAISTPGAARQLVSPRTAVDLALSLW